MGGRGEKRHNSGIYHGRVIFFSFTPTVLLFQHHFWSRMLPVSASQIPRFLQNFSCSAKRYEDNVAPPPQTIWSRIFLSFSGGEILDLAARCFPGQRKDTAMVILTPTTTRVTLGVVLQGGHISLAPLPQITRKRGSNLINHLMVFGSNYSLK